MADFDYAQSNFDFARVGTPAGLQWFPDPFLDYSGLYTPRNLPTMLRWCELMWAHNGTYRTALERVVSYFLTKVEILDVSDSIKKRYEEFLNDTLKVTSQLRTIGLDYLFYGNSFSSVFTPFRRGLRCQRCKIERPIERIIYTFRQFKFYAQCPRCKNGGEHDVVDRPSMEHDKLRVIRWSPHQVQLMYHPLSHNCKYLLRLPEDFKAQLRKGVPFFVQYTPWDVMEAARDNTLFRFNDESIFHLKEDSLAGLHNRGWGIPRALSNFKQGFYIQVLKRYNEALAMDYIVPWRLITPGGPRGEKIDPLLNANLGDFAGRVRGMIAEHRRDPLAMHSLPFPVEYQALGGEANTLAPHELMTTALDELLNACGVPAELYKGTLQLQAAPAALRLFEASWPHLVAGYNNWLCWLLETVAMAFNWDRARAKLTPVTLADDMDARMVRLQLASANKISNQTALSPLGIDVRDEIRRIFDEQRMMQDEQQKMQKEMDQAAEMQRREAETAQLRSGGMPGGQGMPPGGAPPGMGPGGGMGAPGGGTGGAVTPGDILDQADQIAQQLISMPDAARRQQLNQLRQSDETLHAVVKQKLQNTRSQASSVGRQQVLAQMAGQPQQ